MGEGPDDGHVVADQHAPVPVLGLEPAEQAHDVRDEGGVECRHRLVEQQVAGPEHEGPGQSDPLALAPGELPAAPVPEVTVEVDVGQGRDDRSLPLRTGRTEVAQRLAHRRRHRLAGVEGVARVLEGDLDVPTQPPPRPPPERLGIVVVHQHPAVVRPTQERGQPGDGGLAAPALADQAQGFARP